MADKKDETCEDNSFPESKEIKYYASHDHNKGDDVGNKKPRSFVVSTSRVSGEQAFESVSTDSKHEADMQSSDGIASTRPTSVKSDISTEIGLPLSNGSFEMDARKTRGNHLNYTEDCLNTMTRDSQNRTESSCSNSLSVTLPVSLSNHIYQDSFRNCGGSTDDSKSKALNPRPEEPATESSESGVSAQIARKAIKNARTRNSIRNSLTYGNHSSLLANKGDEEISQEWGRAITPENGVGEVLEQTDMNKWASRNTSSTEEQHVGTIGKSSDCSGNSDNFNCITEENIRSSDVHDNHPTSCSGERMISSEISGESHNPLETGPEVMDKIKGAFRGNESSESSMSNPRKVSMKDQDVFVGGFDLNEDINVNGMDDYIQPVVAAISSHSVIQVVAKAGIPRGLPMIPLRFEGGLGWKGSAETSAFRPAALSKSVDRKTCSINYSPKDRQGFTGIDLNIVCVEDTAANGLPMGHEGISSPSSLQDSCLEVDSKRTKNLRIDLNCLYDAADEFTQPSLPPESENPPLVDLNVDISSLGDSSSNVHWLGQGYQSLGNKNSDSANPGQRDFNFTGHDYLADLSTTQHVAHNAHAQQYLVAAPNILQPVELMQRAAQFQLKSPFISHTLPPQNYPYKCPFPFGSGNMPYARYSHEHGIFSELLNHGTVHTSFGAPHLAQVVHGQSTTNVTASTTELDVKTEDNLSTSGSKMDEAGQYLFPAKDLPTGENMQQEVWYAPSTKRKEPEGGLEYYQLGYRQPWSLLQQG